VFAYEISGGAKSSWNTCVEAHRSEFRDQGVRVQGSWCRVQDSGCRVQGVGCRVQGSGCRVQGPDSGGQSRSWSSCVPAASRGEDHLMDWGQLLSRNVERFRGGLVFKAHRFLYNSTLGSRFMREKRRGQGCGGCGLEFDVRVWGQGLRCRGLLGGGGGRPLEGSSRTTEQHTYLVLPSGFSLRI